MTATAGSRPPAPPAGGGGSGPAGTTLVLGTIRGYTWSQVEPFARSLVETGFDGERVLFASGIGSDVVKALESYGFRVRAYRELSLPLGRGRRLHPGHPRLAALRRARATLFRRGRGAIPRIVGSPVLLRRLAPTFTVECARFLLYLSYLLDLPASERPALVVLSDVRDVIFQTDPSVLRGALSPSEDLGVSLEDESMTLGSCRFNSAMISGAYSTQILSLLANLPISCSGVTIGRYSGILRYLQQMTSELLVRDAMVADQACHNYLLHTGQLDPVRIFSNQEGPVFTMGHTKGFSIDSLGKVRSLRKGGSAPVIVHQYDRHPTLAVRFIEGRNFFSAADSIANGPQEASGAPTGR